MGLFLYVKHVKSVVQSATLSARLLGKKTVSYDLHGMNMGTRIWRNAGFPIAQTACESPIAMIRGFKK